MSKFLVWGLGISGRAVVRLLKSKGYEVYVGDDKDKADFREFLPLVDTVVLSPGIPPNHPLWKEALRLGLDVIGELELAWRFFRGRAIAITGTDGKSTTTRLTYLMLSKFFKEVEEGGNIGVPFSEVVLKNPECLAVLEVSSFQGKTLKSFRPIGGAFLNFSTDHLDWHPNLEDYLQSKYNIFSRQREEDFLAVNAFQEETKNTPTKARKILIGEKEAHIKDGKAYIFGREVFSLDRLNIVGVHNAFNMLTAAVIAQMLGVPEEVIKDVAYTFRGLPYRLEYMGEFNGIRIYNDSKSTTPNALRSALESMPDHKVILIAGGKDKGLDFESLSSLVRKKVKACLLIGEAKEKIAKAWNKATDVYLLSSLEEAVEKALRIAQRGDVILFSPACASFDMFRDYKERGERFKSLVEEFYEVYKN
ncbi:UDP-N-acetylmuramoyl-L-alanine--D-glutamate ligase [Thermocrinis sp.]|uniref:UDP-N-acetylmuramoyl-L-alanine--D-glutamate ligase n=1 Tax=Thermocrinis sp. TaxID=2024383 RepID=UPI002FDF0581